MSMGYQQQPRAGGVKPPSGQKTAQRASSSSSGNVAMSHGMQSNMTKRISGAKEQEPDFIAQLSSFMVSNQSAAEKTQKLEENVTVQRSTITSQRKLLETYRSENTVLKDKMEVCGLKIKESEKNRLVLTEQYTNLKTTLDKTKAIIEADNEKLQGLLEWKRKATDRLDTGDDSVKVELNRHEKIMTDQRRKIDELKADSASKEEEKKKAADKHASDIEALQQKIKESKNELDACKVKLQETGSNLRLAEERGKMSESSLKEHKERLKISEANVGKGLNAISELEKNLTSAKSDISVANNKIEALDKNLRESELRSVSIKGELDNTSNKVKELESTVKSQADDIEIKLSEIAELQQKNTTAEQTCQRLNTKITELEENFKKSAEGLSASNDALTLEKNKVTELEEKMSQIESSNESLTQKASQITASASESTKKAQADKKAAADEASRLKKEISKSNKEMAKLKEDAAKHVQGKANLLKAKDEEIKAKDEEIKAKDEEIKAKDEEIKAKDKEVDAKVQSQIDAQIEIKLKKTIESHQLQLDFANKRKKDELDQSKKEKEEMQKQLNEAQEQIKAKDQAISDAASDKGADKIELDKAKQETQEIESRLKSSEEKAAAEANSFKAEIAALVSKIEKMEEEAQAAQRAPPPLLLSVSNAARANVNDTLQNAESSFQFEAEETPRHDPVIKKPVKAAVRRTSKPLSFKKVNTTDSSKVAPRAEKLAPSGNGGRVAGSSLAPIKRAAAIDVEIPDKAGSSKKRRGGDAGPVKAKKQKQTKNAMIKSTASSISSIINNQKPSAARVPSPTKSSGSLSSQASSDLDIFS